MQEFGFILVFIGLVNLIFPDLYLKWPGKNKRNESVISKKELRLGGAVTTFVGAAFLFADYIM